MLVKLFSLVYTGARFPPGPLPRRRSRSSTTRGSSFESLPDLRKKTKSVENHFSIYRWRIHNLPHRLFRACPRNWGNPRSRPRRECSCFCVERKKMLHCCRCHITFPWPVSRADAECRQPEKNFFRLVSLYNRWACLSFSTCTTDTAMVSIPCLNFWRLTATW